MRVSKPLVPLAALALTTIWAQDAPRLATISGTVREAGSGVPMKAVEVSLNRGGQSPNITTTDPQGRYTLRNIPPGPIRVTAMAADDSGNVGFGPVASRQLTLRDGQELSGVDFSLVVFGKIAGRVVDQNKEPVVGMGVYLVTREYSFGAARAFYAGGGITDDQGQYVISRVTPGRAYYVLAKKRQEQPTFSDAPLDPKLRLASVVPTFYPDARAIEGGQPLMLRPGEFREGVDIRVLRSPSFCMEGVIENSPGTHFDIQETQPTSGRSGNGGYYVGFPGGRSAPDGKVRICGLHPGDYEFTVAENNSSNGFGAMLITIGDRDVTNVRLAMRPRLPLGGEVILEGPPPEAPLTSKLQMHVESISRTIRSDATSSIPGTFEFKDGLVADEFSLEFRGLDAGFYVKDVVYGDRSIREGSLRMGTAIGDPGLRVLVARDGVKVTAHVVDKDQPVADCNVVLMPPSAESEAAFAALLKMGKTTMDGTWLSPTVAPGKYLMLATRDDVNRSVEAISKLWKVRNRSTEIEIPPSGNFSATLQVRPIE